MKLCYRSAHVVAVADDVPESLIAAVLRHMAEYHRGPEITACVTPYCDGAEVFRPSRACPHAVPATGA